MLTIETFVGPSSRDGIGLFVSSFVPKGTVWWIRDEKFDKLVSPTDIEKFDNLAIDFIRNYGFLEATGNWYLCIDNARFSNHSDLPNSINNLNDLGEIVSCTVIKDIEAHEEILCDYRKTCATCIIQLGFENKE